MQRKRLKERAEGQRTGGSPSVAEPERTPALLPIAALNRPAKRNRASGCRVQTDAENVRAMQDELCALEESSALLDVEESGSSVQDRNFDSSCCSRRHMCSNCTRTTSICSSSYLCSASASHGARERRHPSPPLLVRKTRCSAQRAASLRRASARGRPVQPPPRSASGDTGPIYGRCRPKPVDGGGHR